MTWSFFVRIFNKNDFYSWCLTSYIGLLHSWIWYLNYCKEFEFVWIIMKFFILSHFLIFAVAEKVSKITILIQFVYLISRSMVLKDGTVHKYHLMFLFAQNHLLVCLVLALFPNSKKLEISGLMKILQGNQLSMDLYFSSLTIDFLLSEK